MISQEYTINELYKSFEKLCNDVEIIKSKLELLPSKNSTQEIIWMSIKELQNYLPEKPASATIYNWVSQKTIPYYKKSKSLTFLKKDIDDWLKSGRINTIVENTNNIKEQVDQYLSTRKKKNVFKTKTYKKQHPT